MMRRRVGPPPSQQQNDGNDSSSDEDVFSKLARKQRNKKQKKNPAPSRESDNSDKSTTATTSTTDTANTTAKASSSTSVATAAAATTKPPPVNNNPALPLATTSSMKRHHKEMTGSRKAKMDALLQELEQEKQNVMTDHHRHHHRSRGPERPPIKKGSFVDPEEEHVTTNIFVGNLAPTLTEEEVTNLFRQFGDLYSVKIMWPRTAEERARERHTGFVCFMNRQDAEDAMAYCDNADPFNVGRRLVLRWGKNVKKIDRVTPIRKRAAAVALGQVATSQASSARQPVYDPAKHASSAIHVTIPASPERTACISMVASYVAKDGSALEQLLEQQGNPQYSFLRLPTNPTQTQKEEHIYYRWRVYSFAQGDGFFVWRADPFVMFHPHGCFWIPPPMDPNAAQQELDHKRQEEERLRREKEERTARRGYVTGRQLERVRKGGPDGGRRLSRQEMEEFHVLFRQNLSIARESICVAMAFCFEKSGAARQIADMLKDLLMEESAGVENRVARLYLLSDILFNSQQPGVRNAFLYRDAIERYAPAIFQSLGKDGGSGRISQNKLATAVSRVLAAWTSWSVYPPFFLDQLQDLFEGKEIKDTSPVKNEEPLDDVENPNDKSSACVIAPNDADLVSTRRKGEWTEIDHTDENEVIFKPSNQNVKVGQEGNDTDGEPLDAGGEPIRGDKQHTSTDRLPSEVDGEPVNPDGEPLEIGGETVDPDGEPLHSSDPDGEPLLPSGPDGEPLDPDGEPLEEDPDGEPLEEDPDGQPIDPDGEPLEDDPYVDPIDADGEQLEEDPDGEPVNADA